MARPAPPTSPTALAPGPPSVAMSSCPIAASLGTLGRKWTLTVLRDIAFFPGATFTLILRNNPGLRQRTLSLRLKQLVSEDLVERQPLRDGGRRAVYRLTEKGQQVWPILTTLLQYGVQNHAPVVFPDGRPRNVEDVFPSDLGLMLGRFAPPGAIRATKNAGA